MRVLHYYNWGYFEPITSGADVIASNQLAYCRHRGWDVDIVLMSAPGRSHQAEAFGRRYSWARTIEVVEAPPGAEFTFSGQLALHQSVARSDAFRRIAGLGHDLLLTNYAFSAPLVEAMPTRCLKLLEALDIVTHSFALVERTANAGRGPLARARDDFSWRMERELYSLFDGVLFINEQEADLAGADLPGRAHHVPPMMPWEAASDDEAIEGRAEDEHSERGFDLLFVGSPAAPNVQGISLFYRNVFAPFLRKHRIRLGIVGKVCDMLDFEDWYVTRLGEVPGDLRDLYERSRIVVIPLLEGSGLSIKTIECLANGSAVATTAVGARGLREDSEAFLKIDPVADPRGSAMAILALLASDAKQAQMRRRARDYYRAHFGRDRYFRAMDRVTESLGLAS